MTLDQLIAHLRAHNIGITSAEGKLSVRADKGAVDRDTLTLLNTH